MEIPIRDARKDYPDLSPSDRSALVQMVRTAGYQVLLEMMERECVQQEINLVNVATGCPDKIVGEHAVTKAFWLFFTRVQKSVAREAMEATTPELPAVSEEEAATSELLDPTYRPPTQV